MVRSGTFARIAEAVMFEVSARASRNGARHPPLRTRSACGLTATLARAGFGGSAASQAWAKRRLVLRWVYTVVTLMPQILMARFAWRVSASAARNVGIHWGPAISS